MTETQGAPDATGTCPLPPYGGPGDLGTAPTASADRSDWSDWSDKCAPTGGNGHVTGSAPVSVKASAPAVDIDPRTELGTDRDISAGPRGE